MTRQRLFLILLMPWLACVDKTSFTSGDARFPLVVDGLFSTGLTEVRISKGYPVNSGLNYTRVPGAQVWITDVEDANWKLNLAEQKQSFEAYQTFNGTIYVASGSAKPQANHQYILHVKIGLDEFLSTPQRVQEPGSVDSIYFTTTTGRHPTTDLEEDVLIVRFDASVHAMEERYYLWRMYGTYSVPAEPQAGPARCWVTEREDAPILSSDAFSGRFAGMTAKELPVRYDRFNDKYRVEIRQYEVSREVWKFMNAIRFQLKNASSIFQPPLSTGTGNVMALNDGTPVIGVFFAALDTSRVLYINPSDLPHEVFGSPIQGNCLQVYPGSLPYPPPFWD